MKRTNTVKYNLNTLKTNEISKELHQLIHEMTHFDVDLKHQLPIK